MSKERAARNRDEGTIPCPQCRADMHPMFLYEDREPDVWLCFTCGHLTWTRTESGRPIPSVDQ